LDIIMKKPLIFRIRRIDSISRLTVPAKEVSPHNLPFGEYPFMTSAS
jgi:hypothetical protein